MTKIEWLNAETSKPPVDEADDWRKESNSSADVLTYSKEYGKRLGRYYHLAERWSIDGVTVIGTSKIPVTHYAFINDPE